MERTLEFEEELAKKFGEDESAGGEGGKEQQQPQQQPPAKPSSLQANSTDVSDVNFIAVAVVVFRTMFILIQPVSQAHDTLKRTAFSSGSLWVACVAEPIAFQKFCAFSEASNHRAPGPHTGEQKEEGGRGIVLHRNCRPS